MQTTQSQQMNALEAKDALTQAGVSPDLAEAHARVTEQQSRAIADARITRKAARKADLARLAADTVSKSDLIAFENRMIKWFAGTTITIVSVVAAIGLAILSRLP